VVEPPLLARMPWRTLGLLSAVLLAQYLPGAADLLVYDRNAIAEGEWWRLVTGNFVHFSGAHLFNNLIVLVPAAWLVEARYRRDAGLMALAAASAIGPALLIGEPQILQYSGASGISLAFLVYAGLRGLREDGSWRMVCMVLLVAIAAKIAAEGAGWHFRDWQADEGFVPVMLSHIVGAATGAAIYLLRAFDGIGDCRSPAGEILKT